MVDHKSKCTGISGCGRHWRDHVGVRVGPQVLTSVQRLDQKVNCICKTLLAARKHLKPGRYCVIEGVAVTIRLLLALHAKVSSCSKV